MNIRVTRCRVVLRAIGASLGGPLAVVVLAVGPATAQTADFFCPERAFDLASCVDPSDLATCIELRDLNRVLPLQEILRIVQVQDGPFAGVGLTMEASNAVEDGRFRAARTELCTGETADPPSEDNNPLTPPGAPTDPIWYGGNPGIYLR
jgi:hypothetical protein